MKKVLLVLVVLVLGFLGFVASRPNTFHIERSTVIAAPADSVYAHIVDFHRWDDWSPWAHLDPSMKADFSGPAAGPGSAYHWAGNDKVGEGRMTVADVEPGRKVGIQLEFIKPFASRNTATFTLAPDAAGTHVTWAMDGPMNFVSKAMCIFMPMDKMIGPDFEKGLAALKHAGESASTATAAAAPADSSGGKK
jgi:hypothetical protein